MPCHHTPMIRWVAAAGALRRLARLHHEHRVSRHRRGVRGAARARALGDRLLRPDVRADLARRRRARRPGRSRARVPRGPRAERGGVRAWAASAPTSAGSSSRGWSRGSAAAASTAPRRRWSRWARRRRCAAAPSASLAGRWGWASRWARSSPACSSRRFGWRAVFHVRVPLALGGARLGVGRAVRTGASERHAGRDRAT